MLVVELEGDDFDKCKGFVKIGRVARAIARAKGASNLLDAERKIFPRINAGVQFKVLNPLSSETLAPLPRDDYGLGIVPFEELAEWGRSTKLFEFEMAREEFENINPVDAPLVSAAIAHMTERDNGASVGTHQTHFMKALEGARMKNDKYESLYELIQPHIDKRDDELPTEIKARVDEEFYPHSWGSLTPAWRCSLAQQLDLQHDPAMEKEM